MVLEPPAGSPQDGVAPDLLFIRVPEGKTVKNRWHPDLRPTDQAAEVARLEALGATRTDVGQGDDVSWIVMADPDGNEFCVLRAFTADELARDRGRGGREASRPAASGPRNGSPRSGVIGETETPETSANGGPSRHQSTSALTAASSPSNSPSTDPAAVLQTQPPTPSRRAS